MVELQATAAMAETFAPAVDFFSIGTNDLTGEVLGLDRRDPAAKPALAAHPRVLALIARIADAGRRAGIPVSVCGDSAADPLVLPLLLGLGVTTLSVPAARVQRVRSWLLGLDTPRARAGRRGTARLHRGRGVEAGAAPMTSAERGQHGSAAAGAEIPRHGPGRLDHGAREFVPRGRRQQPLGRPTRPIEPATPPSRLTMGAATPASPTVASWSSTA